MVSANKELVEKQVADQKAVEDKKNKTVLQGILE